MKLMQIYVLPIISTSLLGQDIVLSRDDGSVRIEMTSSVKDDGTFFYDSTATFYHFGSKIGIKSGLVFNGFIKNGVLKINIVKYGPGGTVDERRQSVSTSDNTINLIQGTNEYKLNPIVYEGNQYGVRFKSSDMSKISENYLVKVIDSKE